MTLSELAVAYRESAQIIKKYLRAHPRTACSTIEEVRKITALEAMQRDTMAMARYLEKYYSGNREDYAAGQKIKVQTHGWQVH